MSEKKATMAQIISELATLEVIANRDPINYGASAPGIVAAARQAQDKIVELKTQYGNILKQNAVPIFLLGEGQNKFSDIARDLFDAIVVDASEVYNSIADYIDLGMSDRREFGLHQCSQLISALREVGIDLGLRDIPCPKHKVLPVILKNVQEISDYIRATIKESMGESVNVTHLEQKIVKQALDAKYSNPSVPVLICGARQDEIDGLSKIFDRTAETLTLTGTVDKEVVTKHFTDIKNKLRSKK